MKQRNFRMIETNGIRLRTVVEGAGHWVQMEKPAETTALILRFLRGL